MSRFLGGRCFGIGVEYGRESKSGLTTRAIHSRDFSALRLRELRKKKKKKTERKISGTKDRFWQQKPINPTIGVGTFKEKSATFALILFAFRQPR